MSTCDHIEDDLCGELAYRESGGVSVRLCWHAPSDEIFVEVRNDREDEHLVVNPPNDQALLVFHHPHALAGRVTTALATRR